MSVGGLLEQVGLLDSDDALTRLAAIRSLRTLLEEAEISAVRSAREGSIRRSWDQIAGALGKTRWSVLRQFGPHGAHAVISPAPAVPGTDAPLGEAEDVDVAGERHPRPEAEVLPAEVAARVLAVLSKLLAAWGPGRTAQVSIRVVPGIVRVEVGGDDPALQLMEQLSDRRGRLEGSPAGRWFELDLRAPSRVGATSEN